METKEQEPTAGEVLTTNEQAEKETPEAEQAVEQEAEAPEPIETFLDPSFFAGDFTRQTRKVRMLETEAFRIKKGLMKADEQLYVTVRALTSDQWFKAKEAGDKADEWAKLRDVYLEKAPKNIPQELRKAMELAEQSVGKETVLRIELLLKGAVNEANQSLFTRSQIVNLAEFFTQDFMELSGNILDLKGEGPQAGE